MRNTPGILQAGKDLSGSITTGGTSQLVAQANSNRSRLDFQNIDDTDMWITETLGAAVVGASGCWKVASGQVWAASTNRAVYVICTTIAKKFTCIEMG